LPALLIVYLSFFNLREMPFSISPDPAYLYMSPRHQEALGHLLYGTGQYGGFVQLTGEVGTGKTTVVRTLLEQKLSGVDVAMIHNPRQSELEFVQSICDELRLSYDTQRPTMKVLVDALNKHLLDTHALGRRTVLIIDEAQNLDTGVLEQVRLLTNLETAKEKLLRIMLVGQPELAELLGRPELRQLSSRITARYHLTPLEENETREYIRHRLQVAGTQEDLFPADAVHEIQRLSRGVPRLVNILCDRALLGAYSLNQRRASIDMVREAAREVFGDTATLSSLASSGRPRWARVGAWFAGLKNPSGWGEALIAGAALMIVGALLYQTVSKEPPPSAPAVAAAPATETAVRPEALAPAASPPTPPPEALLTPAKPPEDPLEHLLRTTLPLNQLTGLLIRLWDPNVSVPKGENVCRVLKARGLECLQATGPWDELHDINRPAILSLADAGQQPKHVLLSAVDGDDAVLETSEGRLSVPIDRLESIWSGEYLLLWRNEIAGLKIGPRSDKDSVRWLQRRLAQLLDRPIPHNPSGKFDESLRADVRAFQQARGLEADGRIGLQTRVALSDASPGTPMLWRIDAATGPSEQAQAAP
jgi:general secretion pathway protein A